MSSRRSLVAFAPALKGLPGSSADLSTRAVPNHPGESTRCLPVASLAVSGFVLRGSLATLVSLSRPNRVYSITARVFAFRVLAKQIAPLRARWATCRTGNYMVNSFQFTRSTRLILAYRALASGWTGFSHLLIVWKSGVWRELHVRHKFRRRRRIRASPRFEGGSVLRLF